ncbi:MAG: guanylate kinase [Oligoflexia bacterium]|nr:guanylate kinase [Oligoflexia bacterium]
MNKAENKLIIIVAPSGAGKSTLIKKIHKDFEAIKESVSFTTRKMRPGDIEGVSYFFISKEEFQEKIKNDDFLEWAQVHSNYYGTSKSFIKKQLDIGHTILLDIDTQGADALKNIYHDRAKAIFICPPSIEELEKRLVFRGSDSIEIIKERINNAKKELLKKDCYDYLVVNDNLETAYDKLKIIITEILHKK